MSNNAKTVKFNNKWPHLIVLNSILMINFWIQNTSSYSSISSSAADFTQAALQYAQKYNQPTLELAHAPAGYGYYSSSQAHAPSSWSPTITKSEKNNSNRSSRNDEIVGTEAASSVTSTTGTSHEQRVILKDPNLANTWALLKTSAPDAWKITQGSKKIVVAVIDTGVDVHHPDVMNNLWVHPSTENLPKEQQIHGWNFVSDNFNLTDNNGHGTHIAGIIGGHGHYERNGELAGVIGVSPNISLMILKYYDPTTNNLGNTVKAIRYAVDNGAKIINYSGGGPVFSKEEYEAVKYAESKGVLFVAAAGNEHSNTDDRDKHFFPADYGLSNIISVTAVDKKETKVLPSSNYGVRTVDLAAPGENINSALPGGMRGNMTGTSQATAFVTGVAALIMAHNPDLKYSEIKKYILRTGDEYPTLLSKTGTAKLLNSYKALTSLDINLGVTGVLATNTSSISPHTFNPGNNIAAVGRQISPSPLTASSLIPQNSNGSNLLVGDQDPTENFARFSKKMMKAFRSSSGNSGSSINGSNLENDFNR